MRILREYSVLHPADKLIYDRSTGQSFPTWTWRSPLTSVRRSLSVMFEYSTRITHRTAKVISSSCSQDTSIRNATCFIVSADKSATSKMNTTTSVENGEHSSGYYKAFLNRNRCAQLVKGKDFAPTMNAFSGRSHCQKGSARP